MGHRGAELVCDNHERQEKDPHSGPNVDAQVGERKQGGVVKVKKCFILPTHFTFHRNLITRGGCWPNRSFPGAAIATDSDGV